MEREKKINLVVFTREYPVGMASTKRIQHLLEFISQQGVIVNVLAFRGTLNQPAFHGLHNNVSYSQVGHGTRICLKHLFRIIHYYFYGLSLITKNQKKGFTNIVYKAGGINVENILFVLWAKMIGFKMILAIEEDWKVFTDNIKLLSRFKVWTINQMDFLNCRWADEIIVISTFLREKYLQRKSNNITLIPVTARINFNGSKEGFNRPLQIVYAGTFADKDGVDDIINGFVEFRKAHEDAILILTGKSEQQTNYVVKYQNEEGIEFKGFMNDTDFYRLLRDSDVLCMCRTESGFANAGFPFKLGEYLATGNPVICTKVSDVEHYLDEDDAYLIEPGNPQQITEALLNIVNFPDEARARGMKGLEKCRKFFSADTNGRILLDVLERI